VTGSSLGTYSPRNKILLLTVYLADDPCDGSISSYDEHNSRNVPVTHAAEQTDFMFKGQEIIEHLVMEI
jgi:hypothetical protein